MEITLIPSENPESISFHKLLETCNIPEFLAPWIQWFYEPDEIVLIEILAANGPLHPGQAVKRLSSELNSSLSKDRNGSLERAYKRGVISKKSDGRLTPADFNARFELWALFEGWRDLPESVRHRLNQWEFARYINDHQQRVETLKAGGTRNSGHPYPEYVLLPEADALLERVEHVYLWPCDCRAMMDGCKHSRSTCLRFENDRGIGWEISKDRAKEIVQKANQEGLIQSAELAIDPNGRLTGAICNCCSDCCFPQRLGRELEAETFWPLVRYSARIHPENCSACGRCVKRCPFGAVNLRGKSRRNRPKAPEIRADHCRGCGLCATGCTTRSIGMEQVRCSAVEFCYRPVFPLPHPSGSSLELY